MSLINKVENKFIKKKKGKARGIATRRLPIVETTLDVLQPAGELL